ncbi:MAG: hypothetical protein RR058_06785 [Oscillospiraceae bacterium]
MRLHSSNKSALALLEFLFAFLIFISSAVVTARFLLRASQLREEIFARDAAVEYVNSLSERIKASDGDEASLDSILEGSFENDTYTLFVDGDFAKCRESDAVYIVTFRYHMSDFLLDGELSLAKEGGAPVFAVPVVRAYDAFGGTFNGE